MLADAQSSFGWLLLIIIMVMGVRQWGKWLKGSPTLRTGVKHGALNVLIRLFKK